MTVEPGDAAASDSETGSAGGPVPDSEAGTDGARRPDSGHLDEDPEALEDPVHRGDAQHQHDLHARPADRDD